MQVEAVAARREIGPDFVGVGVQRAGSTFVADLLRQHPQVWMREKEISFFTRHYHRGWDWYEAHFADRRGRAAGEFSVNYFYAPRPDSTRREFYPWWNPRRKLQFWRKLPSPRDALAARYPGLRVFVVLRNPVERAWSHYWYWIGRRTRAPDATRSRSGPRPSSACSATTGAGLRRRDVMRITSRTGGRPSRSIGVFFYDDLRARPAELARALYRFVGVDAGFAPKIDARSTRATTRRCPSSCAARLIAHYREQVERLEPMVGRDLSGWLAELGAPAHARSASRRQRLQQRSHPDRLRQRVEPAVEAARDPDRLAALDRLDAFAHDGRRRRTR